MDVLVLIDRLEELVEDARSFPGFGNTAMVDRDAAFDIIDQMRQTIHEELKQARWIVKERQAMLDEARDVARAHGLRRREAEAVLTLSRIKANEGDAAAAATDAQAALAVLDALDLSRESVLWSYSQALPALRGRAEYQGARARVKALLRRTVMGGERQQRCGPLAYDLDTRRFTLGKDLLTLTSREQAVLEALIARPGRVMSKEQLAAQVFGLDEEASADAIEIYVHRLRKKLEADPKAPRYLQTVRGIGYMLAPD